MPSKGTGRRWWPHSLTQVSLRAVSAVSRSRWNDGYGRDTGPSRGDPCRHTFRPIEASKAVVCYVRNTSRHEVAPLQPAARVRKRRPAAI